MKECLIRNLCDGPRDYPLVDGTSIYLGSKSRANGIVRIQTENISEALRLAESKGLVLIEEIRDGEIPDEETHGDEESHESKTPDDGKPDEGETPDEGGSDEESSHEDNPDEDKPDEGSSHEDSPAEDKPDEGGSHEDTPAEDKPDEGGSDEESPQVEAKRYLVTNLCNGPCDYPLADGSSIYLGSKNSSTGAARIWGENISEALRLAESKGFISIEEIPANNERGAA